MDTILTILSILIFILLILSISRIQHKEHFNKIIVEHANIPYDLTYDIPFNKDHAFALCDETCEKNVQQEWRNNEEPHGWKPFGYWNGDWAQQKFKVKYVPKYRLLCGCNKEY